MTQDQRGVTSVEFALIAPVLLTLLFGVYDLGFTLYVNSMLQGSIQQAGRNSTIEGATTASMDQIVTNAVRSIMPAATLSFTRKSYVSFSNVSTPEDFIDVNSNSVCDSGEAYTDSNGNSTWDADRGKTGNGGARDAVLYTVTVSYPRPFAMAGIAGFSNTVTMTTQTVLRNQPFGTQSAATTTKYCP
jgi:Flp pilus assembly protein TadG